MSSQVPKRGAFVLLMLIVTLAITAAAVAQVRTHLRAIDLGYKIARARHAQQALRERNRRLHIELALLKNPEQIARIAREELGFTEPEPEQIHRLRALRPTKHDAPTEGVAPQDLARRPLGHRARNHEASSGTLASRTPAFSLKGETR